MDAAKVVRDAGQSPARRRLRPDSVRVDLCATHHIGDEYHKSAALLSDESASMRILSPPRAGVKLEWSAPYPPSPCPLRGQGVIRRETLCPLYPNLLPCPRWGKGPG